MKFEAMFQPVKIGNMTVPNRFVMSPMGNNFANTDGKMSERSAAYYGARAKGGFGLITFEATVVYKEAKGGPRKPCLFSDDTVSNFKEAILACHKEGAKVSIQLQHAGPEGNSKVTGYPLKSASSIPASVKTEIPKAISTEELYRLIEAYGDAALRAKQAGADAVEVHCAHGYLVSSFISERTNKRQDEFGGCFENRMRLPKLIIENIRKKTGGTLAVICRINGSDDVVGGQTPQDAAAVASYLKKECGVDALHVSRAVHLHDEYMWGPSVLHEELRDELGADVIPEHRKFLMKELNEYQVQGITGAKVTEFHEDGVSYVLENGTEGRVEQVDTVVLAMGYRNYDPLSQEIKVFAKEVFVIGDSVRARRAMDATKEAFETAMMI